MSTSCIHEQTTIPPYRVVVFNYKEAAEFFSVCNTDNYNCYAIDEKAMTVAIVKSMHEAHEYYANK